MTAGADETTAPADTASDATSAPEDTASADTVDVTAGEDVTIAVITHGDGGVFWSVARRVPRPLARRSGITVRYYGSNNTGTDQAACHQPGRRRRRGRTRRVARRPRCQFVTRLRRGCRRHPGRHDQLGLGPLQGVRRLHPHRPGRVPGRRRAPARSSRPPAPRRCSAPSRSRRTPVSTRVATVPRTRSGRRSWSSRPQVTPPASSRPTSRQPSTPTRHSTLSSAPARSWPTMPQQRSTSWVAPSRSAAVDLSSDLLDDIAAGTVAFTIDQQQYLQGYIAGRGAVPQRHQPEHPWWWPAHRTGPGFVTKDNAEAVKALVAAGTR